MPETSLISPQYTSRPFTIHMGKEMNISPACPDGHARMIIWQDFLDGRSWMSFMAGRFHRRRVDFPLTIEGLAVFADF
jgi:hypothetical protein